MADIVELIRQMPKCELHCHLDGSMRVGTIIDLAKKQDVSLPSFEEEELRSILVQDEAASLVQYLKAFDVTLSVLQDYESLKRTAYELIQDCAAENIRYIEVRYAPLLHQRRGMRLTSIVEAVLDGLKQGFRDFGVRWGLIICGMRSSDPRYTLQMAELCIAYRHRGVVAFDLAGGEAGNPAADHAEAFRLILRNNVNVTIHAGEAYGPESISQALHECGAHRLGHAVRLKEDGDLLNYCCDHRIPLEMCPTSNVQTGAVPSIAQHPLRFYYDFGLRTVVCSDNNLMSGVTVTDELIKAHRDLGFSLPEIKDLVVYSFKSTFQHHRVKVEMLESILHEIKDLRDTHTERDTGAAVADIPTEAFTGSSKTRDDEGEPVEVDAARTE